MVEGEGNKRLGQTPKLPGSRVFANEMVAGIGRFWFVFGTEWYGLVWLVLVVLRRAR